MPLAKALIRKAFKETEIIRDDDGEWYSPRAAARHLGTHIRTIWRWCIKGCGWLGGKPPITRTLRDGLGTPKRYYLKSELDEIQLARGRGAVVPDLKKWVSVSKAAKEFRLSSATLHNWSTKGCSALGRKIRSRATYSQTTAAHGRECRMLWRDDLEQAFEKSSVTIQDDKIPLRDAAKLLGVTPEAITYWRGRGASRIGGKQLAAANGKVVFAGYARDGVLLSKKEVNEIQEALAKPIDRPVVDGKGTWLSVNLAGERYPNATPHILRKYRNKPLDDLGGKILHARKIPRPPGMMCPHHEVWVYLESDVKRLNPPSSLPRWRRPVGPAVEIEAVQTTEPAPKSAAPKRSRGRQPGWRDPDVKRRTDEMLADWDQGKFNGNKAAAARAHGLHRPDASKLIDAHERAKA